MRESILQKRCNAIARERGWWPIKLESPGVNGLPDVLYLGDGGRVRLAEFKQKRGHAAALQLLMIERLRGLGFDVQIIRTVADFEEWL